MEQANRVETEYEAWDWIDKTLRAFKYMRFGLSSYRSAEHAREWEAVIFMEKGKVLARVRNVDRAEALVLVVKAMEK